MVYRISMHWLKFQKQVKFKANFQAFPALENIEDLGRLPVSLGMSSFTIPAFFGKLGMGTSPLALRKAPKVPKGLKKRKVKEKKRKKKQKTKNKTKQNQKTKTKTKTKKTTKKKKKKERKIYASTRFEPMNSAIHWGSVLHACIHFFLNIQ